MKTLLIDTSLITDYDTFHQVFSEAMGFPGWYGNNISAWIDCMGYVDEPDSGMTAIHVARGELLLLELVDTLAFAKRCPDIYNVFIECVTFVNWTFIERGETPVLGLLLR